MHNLNTGEEMFFCALQRATISSPGPNMSPGEGLIQVTFEDGEDGEASHDALSRQVERMKSRGR